ncbi:MAG: TonB family protein [Candidatus Aminicenantes bacterium]|nr:TonB family protein [Candidatus Aminicenantes bacterium]
MKGQHIGKYVIESELGRGAMGVVYKAVDPVIGRTVAIKTIRFDVLTDSGQRTEAQKRFLREAQSAGGLSHPNIATIYDIGEADGTTYIAMEYVEGRSLESLLASGERWDISQIIPFAVQMAEALDAAHRKGIIHRDIKPGNILVDAEGRPHIVDFGIARISSSTMTQTSMVMGTPFYMAPEQIAGRKVDHRADIFALGAVLYEMLTLEKPFPGETLTTVIYKIMNEYPAPIRTIRKEIPEEIAAIVEKALAKETGDRYASCRELIADLSPFLSGMSLDGSATAGRLTPSPGLPAVGKKGRRAKPQAKERKAPAGFGEAAAPQTGAGFAVPREAGAGFAVPREAGTGFAVPREAGTDRSNVAVGSNRKPLLIVVGLMLGLVGVIAGILILSSRKQEPGVSAAGGAFKVEFSEKGVLGGEGKISTPPPGDQGSASLPPPRTESSGTDVQSGAATATGELAKQTEVLVETTAAAGRTETIPPPSGKPDGRELPVPAKEEPAKPAVASKPGPTRLPRLLRQVDPVYPADALAGRIDGDVKLEVTIGFTGRVEKARIIKSVPMLDMAALDAVGKWKFEPGLFEGIPIQATLETTIHFTLPPAAALPQPAQTTEKPAPAKAPTNVTTLPPVTKTQPAGQTPSQPTTAQMLAQASEALNRGAFRDALTTAETLLASDPNLAAAKSIALDAVIRLAPGEIKDLVDQYALGYKVRQPAEFFRAHALPEVYLRIRSDLETMMSAYRDIKIAVSKLNLDFQMARYPEFSTRAIFSQVMTGISVAKGARGLMFDGRYSWTLERRSNDWVITGVKVE